MAENSEIAELTEMMEDRKSVEDDFSMMFGSLRDMVERKYLRKARQAADMERKLVSSRPPREVALLRALRAYANEEGQAGFDQMIRLAMTMHTLRHMDQELKETAKRKELSAMADGESDAAPNPTAKLLMTLALLDII